MISWETMILSTLSSTMCFRRRRLFTLAPHSLTHSLARMLELALLRQLLGWHRAASAIASLRRALMVVPTTYFLMHISMGLEDPTLSCASLAQTAATAASSKVSRLTAMLCVGAQRLSLQQQLKANCCPNLLALFLPLPEGGMQTDSGLLFFIPAHF